jgi:hypothetical protein
MVDPGASDTDRTRSLIRTNQPVTEGMGNDDKPDAMCHPDGPESHNSAETGGSICSTSFAGADTQGRNFVTTSRTHSLRAA